MTRSSQTALPIQFQEVTYGRGSVTFLEKLTLTLEPGLPTVVIGANGSGKTTFLRLAMGLLVPTAGRICWAGHDAYPNSSGAFMFQRPTMLRRTVADNVRYALRAAAAPRHLESDRIQQLLSMVELTSRADAPARRLSGGEQQRLALARVLARDPEILFLDEPTASLDPAAKSVVEELLRTVACNGTKIVMSTHDLGEARRLASDILMLHRGRLVEYSPTATFFNAPRSTEARSFLSGELLP